MKGLPLTYNRDMQEDKEPLFDAADQLTGSLEMARVVADSVKLHARPAAAAAAESWVVATDLAEALARAGVPFHQAHQIVGRLVLESVRQRQETGGLDGGRSWPQFAPEFRAATGAAARSGGRHEVARDSRRHGAGERWPRRWWKRARAWSQMRV